MKERDIIDFEKYEKNENGDPVGENGEDLGCLHCKVHEKAYEVLNPLQDDKHGGLIPLCPKCSKPLKPYTTSGYSDVIVSEVNFYEPDGEIGLYRCYHCEECNQNYAMMPIPITYNANHDTHYTGGKMYAEDKDIKELCKLISECVIPSINNYVERKLHPEDEMDKHLDLWNVDTWCTNDIEHKICEWLYERGFKK